MKRIQVCLTLIACMVVTIGSLSCKKFLDAKPREDRTEISNLRDLQALLDQHTRVMQVDVTSAEVSSDNYYLNYADYIASARSEQDRNMYRWETDIYPRTGLHDWINMYEQVYRANLILDFIDGMYNNPNTDEWENIKGQGYFLRGYCFYQAAMLWAPAFDSATATIDLGIPLRLNSVFSEPSVRASNAETYNQIISDLKASIPLLPTTPIHPMRSSKPAAYGILARVYLAMRNYDSCLYYANACLQLRPTLLDYKIAFPSVIPNSIPFSFSNASLYQHNHPENIYHRTMYLGPAILANSRAKIDSNLYLFYSNDDRRKDVFFKSNAGSPVTYAFRGSYEGSNNLYCGLATDEVYLMRAECYARKDDRINALKDLNTLMRNRWKAGFVDISTGTSELALQEILKERRKELLLRGLRWMDIKRLNKTNGNIELRRKLFSPTGTLEYSITPNSPRFALPLPFDIIELTGMQQNPR